MQTHRYLKDHIQRRVQRELKQQGYAFVRRQDHYVEKAQIAGLEKFRASYKDFPIDNHLNDGEGHRIRTYGRFLFEPKTGTLRIFAHDTFFQSAKFDELYGDIHREFSPLLMRNLENLYFLNTLIDDFYNFPIEKEFRDEPFEISAHLIRIASVPGNNIGRPAPEGIHQDGYHFGVARLFARQNIIGAESRVHNLQKEIIDRGYLLKPMDALYMNDRAIFHSVEPFEAADPSQASCRDVLISLYQPLSESPQKPARTFSLDRGGILAYLCNYSGFNSPQPSAANLAFATSKVVKPRLI